MSRTKIKLPLPSRCVECGLAIKAVRHLNARKTFEVVWVHDAPIMTLLRKGGAHNPVPDPAYQPQRGRDMGRMDGDFRGVVALRHHIRGTMVA